MELQTINIKIASGTSGLKEFSERIRDVAKKAVGIAAIENKAGGISNYRLEIRDQSKTHIDRVNKKLFEFSEAVPQGQRFIDIDIPGEGQQLNIAVEIEEETTQELNIDIVLLLQTAKDC